MVVKSKLNLILGDIRVKRIAHLICNPAVNSSQFKNRIIWSKRVYRKAFVDAQTASKQRDFTDNDKF